MKRELLDSEYDEVIAYIQSSGINDDKLVAEMTDHLVILTELYLDEENDFESAFKRAKQDVKQKDLLEINENAEGFKGYPKFLGKKFLILFGTVLVSVFICGLAMKYNHIPRHRPVIIISRRLISFAFLPLLLLYKLTISANKTRQVLQFVFQFSLFQTVAEYLIRQKVNMIFLSSSIVFGLAWLAIFVIAPWIKSKKNDHIKMSRI